MVIRNAPVGFESCLPDSEGRDSTRETDGTRPSFFSGWCAAHHRRTKIHDARCGWCGQYAAERRRSVGGGGRRRRTAERSRRSSRRARTWRLQRRAAATSTSRGNSLSAPRARRLVPRRSGRASRLALERAAHGRHLVPLVEHACVASLASRRVQRSAIASTRHSRPVVAGVGLGNARRGRGARAARARPPRRPSLAAARVTRGSRGQRVTTTADGRTGQCFECQRVRRERASGRAERRRRRASLHVVREQGGATGCRKSEALAGAVVAHPDVKRSHRSRGHYAIRVIF